MNNPLSVSPSATRHNIHIYPYFLFAAIHHLKSSPTFSVRSCSSVGRVTVDLIRRSWVRFPPRSKDFFFASCGSLFPFTRAKGTGKQGHIAAHDVSWAAQTGKHLLRTQNVSEQNQKHFLCPQQMLRARANGETFVSATMCPQQCVLVCKGLNAQ